MTTWTEFCHFFTSSPRLAHVVIEWSHITISLRIDVISQVVQDKSRHVFYRRSRGQGLDAFSLLLFSKQSKSACHCEILKVYYFGYEILELLKVHHHSICPIISFCILLISPSRPCSESDFLTGRPQFVIFIKYSNSR